MTDHSRAATVRQLLRYCLLLEQGRLVSPEASKTMREIFASPDIRHENNKFVKGLAGKDVQILRKSGSWENWLLDLAIVTGPNRHYVIAALTEHPAGDDYLAEFPRARRRRTQLSLGWVFRRSAGFPTCCIAGFQPAQAPNCSHN